MFSRGWAVKALSFVGLHGSNTVLRAGPGAGGLGSVPTLLTVLYAAAAVRQVNIYRQTLPATSDFRTNRSTGLLLQTPMNVLSHKPASSCCTFFLSTHSAP